MFFASIECNKYGFDLTFFDTKDIDALLNIALVSVIIIDLSSNEKLDPYQLGEKSREKTGFPLFGVLDQFNRKNQNKAKDCGFDLVFTKKMLLRSIKEIVVHINNEE